MPLSSSAVLRSVNELDVCIHQSHVLKCHCCFYDFSSLMPWDVPCLFLPVSHMQKHLLVCGYCIRYIFVCTHVFVRSVLDASMSSVSSIKHMDSDLYSVTINQSEY